MVRSVRELTVFRVVRGMVAGAAVAAALTACGGNGGAGSGSTDRTSTSSSTDSRVGADDDQSKAPVVLTGDQVRRALVNTGSAPQGWEGFGVDMDVPAASLETCRADTATQCGGFVALGSSHIQQGSEEQVVFTIYAFKTPTDAKSAMKGLAAKERRRVGAGAKPLKVSADADQTDAFTGRNTEIFMRLGGTLVRVASKGLPESEPYDDFARLQIDRIKQTVEGENAGD
ncbi:hypothetical protein AB0F96_29720 [Streptomyces sp. NPDC023998]|uniref:hypothetical protein n=1 Tax=Streptomyces sp. NPDC023998 TaxID=3154597 RepID=UPI0033D09721